MASRGSGKCISSVMSFWRSPASEEVAHDSELLQYPLSGTQRRRPKVVVEPARSVSLTI